MSLLEWAVFLIGSGVILIIWQLRSIGFHLRRMTKPIESLDAEVFRLAQEQNPNYGKCSKCGRRAIVRYVIPKGMEVRADDPEMFYCQSCWWMSDSVQVSDENVHYKDRLVGSDHMAARAGPK